MFSVIEYWRPFPIFFTSKNTCVIAEDRCMLEEDHSVKSVNNSTVSVNKGRAKNPDLATPNISRGHLTDYIPDYGSFRDLRSPTPASDPKKENVWFLGSEPRFQFRWPFSDLWDFSLPGDGELVRVLLHRTSAGRRREQREAIHIQTRNASRKALNSEYRSVEKKIITMFEKSHKGGHTKLIAFAPPPSPLLPTVHRP